MTTTWELHQTWEDLRKHKMMNNWQRLQLAIAEGRRAWKAGTGAFSAWESTGGHDDSEYSPEEYGDYLLTSNAVYTCATIRAESLAPLPFRAYKLDDKGKKQEMADHAVQKLLRKVNDYWTMNRLLNMSEMSLCLWGKCFLAVERGSSTKGEPRELWWMKPTQVTVYPDPVNYIKGFEYTPMDGGKPIWFNPWEVIWLRYPNPLDEYSGLSPIAAARLAADIASAAGKSNKYLFDHGYQMGGIVTPKSGTTLTSDQAKEIEASLDKRFKGVDKAHRWGVFRFEAEMKQMSVTPKDAEFLGALNFSLEDVARAYKVPLDMVGGQRTYENVKNSDRALWMRAMQPESIFFASEFTEQLLPMYGKGRPDLIEADCSKVPAMQDDEGEVWDREQGQITVGAITINEWREKKGLDAVDWGNEWWAPMTSAPVRGTRAPVGTLPAQDLSIPAIRQVSRQRIIEFGSDEHERLWRRFERRSNKWEKAFKKAVVELLERQRDSVLDKLKAEKKDDERNDTRINLEDLFDFAAWVKRFRVVGRELIGEIVGDTGNEALDELEITSSFDLKQPAVVNFIEKRAQRFAEEVNESTWAALKKSLAEGIDNGEGLVKLMERVREVMEDRIRSSSETIARTEVIGAMNGGTLQAWKQCEVVNKKAWLAALDERTRDTHIQAHERYQAEPIDLEDEFVVGDGAGQAPGQIGLPEEDINCRCTMVPVVEQ